MSFIQTISDFFESIFKRSSPEVQKKQLLKKLDSEIREFNPLICKSGMLQPNFGEAIYGLYKNCKPLDNLFSVTVSLTDLPRQRRFEAQLVVTAYSAADQEALAELSFEQRKQAVLAEDKNPDRVYIRQRQQMERLLKELNTENFKKMDMDILNLRQLVELCHYSFIPFLQAFDSSFLPGDMSYKPSYIEVPVAKALNLLEDLYYQTAGLKLTTTTGEAVLALAQLRKGSELTESEKKSYLSNLKKIRYILTKVLSSEKLKTIIRYCKQDATYEPKIASYTGSPRQDFANMIQSRFDAEEQRIKTEIQDERISEDVKALFPDMSLEEVGSYNQTYNEMLQTEASLGFKWILPLRVLKTFLKIYLTPPAKTLLNDIVIEGFFNNPTYKSSFSSIVYAAINSEEILEAFEASFGNDKPNSIAVLESYIKDSKKDKDFFKRLEKMVNDINNQAHENLQNIVTNLCDLYKQLGELLADAKKPSSEIISNLKVLMMSSRNRDSTSFLEANYNNWKIFFEIMKNYVIINIGEINHE